MALATILVQAALALVSALAFRVIYNIYFHPLAGFAGPWYLAASSFPLALMSLLKREPEFLLSISRKYANGIFFI